jgi:acyl-CoA thioesterase-1
VSTADLDLAYLDDDLHLTYAGHLEFGDAVADRITRLRHPS